MSENKKTNLSVIVPFYNEEGNLADLHSELVDVLSGEKNLSATLTEQQVLEIRKDPRPQRTIAAEYGCVQQTVSRIKRRKIWKHLKQGG